MKNKLFKNVLIGTSILTIGLFPISYFNIKKEKDVINYQIKKGESKTIDDEYITADVNIGSNYSGNIVAEFEPFYLQKGDYSYLAPDYKYTYDLYKIEDFVVEIPYERMDGDAIEFGRYEEWKSNWKYDSNVYHNNEYSYDYDFIFSVIPDYIYNKGARYTQSFFDATNDHASNLYYSQLEESGTIHLAFSFNFNGQSDLGSSFDGEDGKTSKPFIVNINYQHLPNDTGYQGYGEKYDIWYKEEKDNAYTIKLKTQSNFDPRLGTIHRKDQKYWDLNKAFGISTSAATSISGRYYDTDISLWDPYYYFDIFGTNAITNTINLGTLDWSKDSKNEILDAIDDDEYWYSNNYNNIRWYVPLEQVTSDLGLSITSADILENIEDISSISSDTDDRLSNTMKAFFTKINDWFAEDFEEAGIYIFDPSSPDYNSSNPKFYVDVFRENYYNSYGKDSIQIREINGELYFEVNGNVDFDYYSSSSDESKFEALIATEAIFNYIGEMFSGTDIDSMIERMELFYRFEDYNYASNYTDSFYKYGYGIVPLSDGGVTRSSIKSNSEILLIVLTILSILMLLLIILLLFRKGVKEDKGVQIIMNDEEGDE